MDMIKLKIKVKFNDPAMIGYEQQVKDSLLSVVRKTLDEYHNDESSATKAEALRNLDFFYVDNSDGLKIKMNFFAEDIKVDRSRVIYSNSFCELLTHNLYQSDFVKNNFTKADTKVSFKNKNKCYWDHVAKFDRNVECFEITESKPQY